MSISRTTLLLALGLAIGSPTLQGCDKLTGEKDKAKSESKSDDDDDDKDSKKKKKKAAADPVSTDSPKDTSVAPTPAAGASLSSNHMPGNCEVAISTNLAKLTQHPAVAAKIMPPLEAIVNSESKDDDVRKMQGFMKSAGISIKSFQNATMCVRGIGQGKSQESFAFAVGGDFKPDTFVAAIEKMRTENGKDPITFIDVDGKKVLSDKDFSFGQFSDGVLGMSKQLDDYKAMQATNDNAKTKYKLGLDKELSFSVDSVFLKQQLDKDRRAPPPFKAITTLVGGVDLGASKVELVMGTGSAEDAKKLDALVTLMKDEFKKKGGIEQMLSGYTSTVSGNDVVVTFVLPPELLNKGVDMVAGELEKAKGKL